MRAVLLCAAIASFAASGCSPLIAAFMRGGGSAGTLSVGQTVHADTSEATDEREPTCGSSAGAPDHAWTFVPETTGRYRVHVRSSYDAVLAVLRGADEGDVVDCNDDHGSTSESQVLVDLEAGQTYTLLVDGYSGASGEYWLSVHEQGGATGGEIALGQAVRGDTRESSNSFHPTCGASNGPDQAWRFVPPGTGAYTFHVDAEYDSVLAVFDDDGGSLGCNDDFGSTRASRLVLELPDDRAVWIVVDGYQGASGRYTLRAERGGAPESGPPGPAPPPSMPDPEAPTPDAPPEQIAAMEGRCAQAPVLAAGRTLGYVDPAVAHARTSCGAGGRGGEVVYRLELGRRSHVRIAEESLFDAVLELRERCSENHRVLQCTDDTGDVYHSEIEATLPAGTYYVIVDSYGAGSSGAFSLEVAIDPMAER